jgi:putative ABC transport system permease protein
VGLAVLFGLAPAIIGSRTELTPALRNVASGGPRRFPLRGWLALFQLALSLVALTSTAVLGQSFWNARHGDVGLSRKNVLTAWQGRADLNVERTALDRIRAVPGVRQASVAFRAPLSHSGGGVAMAIKVPGHSEFSAGQAPAVIKYNSVEGRYFQLLGIRLLKGRSFEEADREGAPRVAVISESMARRYWPNDDPIGKDIRAEEARQTYRIVGVVADAPINSIGEIPEPYFYTSWWQNPFGEHTLLIESQAAPALIAPVIRSTLAGVSPDLKRVSLVSLDDLIEDSTTSYRATAQLVAALGILGLLLAAVGFYGVIAYGVTLRTREIGIRMAIGARQADASRMVVRQALLTAVAGLAIGLPCSLAATFAIRSALFGVSPWSPPAFIGAALILLMVALAAAWLPARRAAAVDPVIALRCE